MQLEQVVEGSGHTEHLIWLSVHNLGIQFKFTLVWKMHPKFCDTILRASKVMVTSFWGTVFFKTTMQVDEIQLKNRSTEDVSIQTKGSKLLSTPCTISLKSNSLIQQILSLVTFQLRRWKRRSKKSWLKNKKLRNYSTEKHF